jgi:hypothetical protein
MDEIGSSRDDGCREADKDRFCRKVGFLTRSATISPNEVSVLQAPKIPKIQLCDRTKKLVFQIAAWQRQRNEARARVKWMFTTERARTKLAHAYPDPTKES